MKCEHCDHNDATRMVQTLYPWSDDPDPTAMCSECFVDLAWEGCDFRIVGVVTSSECGS